MAVIEAYEGGAHYAYATDALGSVRMLTGGAQNATDTYAYDPWGATTSQSGSLANPLQYAAAVVDPTNSLYDMGARVYDPASGGGHRFLSADPMGGGYAYAADGPANFVDPTGLVPAHFRSGPTAPASMPATTACTLDEMVGSGCPGTPTEVQSPSGTGGGDVNGAAPSFWGRCGLDITCSSSILGSMSWAFMPATT